MDNTTVKVGIIGGTGFNDPKVLGIEDPKSEDVITPFGKPSGPVLTGSMLNVPVAILARHGPGHRVMPSLVNYRANVWALRQLGCTHLLVTTACGSLKEEIRPGQLVFLDQFIDRTTKRALTFFDGTSADLPGICHLPMAEPFCSRTRQILSESAAELGLAVHASGTAVCIEGPRFSTRAESHLYRSWGCDVVNMTSVPEVTLAAEAGLCYAAVAMPTDYDCWRPGEGVSVDMVMATFRANVQSVTRLIREAVPRIAKQDWAQTLREKQKAVSENTMLPGH